MNANMINAALTRLIADKLIVIQSHVDEVETMRKLISEDTCLSDEPISKVLISSGDRSQQSDVWYPYKSQAADNGHISIHGIRGSIREVRWFSDRKIIEVTIESEERTIQETKFFVSPLEEVEPGMEDDQVRSAGDTAILCGQYMVIAGSDPDEVSNEEYPDGLFCDSFLKIMSIEEPTQSDRGGKRRQAAAKRMSQLVGGSATKLL